ncbi:membrane bound adenylate/guanylate cyclase with PAS domain [Naegleria gruberi]|uniref:Membrane bound adenylate/guanylate cyclase with PAS domain n=1 Tax=Naegleria gruberi TaxID=5762 RepID=D2VLR5_NAEGR|nr:membrane bound adenylate/guanylate cyclase with PAS domain [Naegleria gruberi]EFC42187.1 membrane bound adenylate/guanylate cyclase with PAS domain [Naegleria gruberi]|eukprot:XP_002674931.1 membrane bound adenylate/guanylate cyclase with PAS domain [Naegleria gruberi strain NEG-M]
MMSNIVDNTSSSSSSPQVSTLATTMLQQQASDDMSIPLITLTSSPTLPNDNNNNVNHNNNINFLNSSSGSGIYQLNNNNNNKNSTTTTIITTPISNNNSTNIQIVSPTQATNTQYDLSIAGVGGGNNPATASDNMSSFNNVLTTSSGAPTSVFQLFNEKLANFYLTVKTSETEIRMFERVLIFGFYMYMYWVNLIFPTLSSERSNYPLSNTNYIKENPYGQYASWVFRVLNYPITLSLDAIGYTAKIAITSVLMAMYFIFMAILVTEFRTLKGKAKRFCNNGWTRILIMERMKEIEVYSSTKTHGINQVEIKTMLHDLEKQQDELWSIHRMFWKEIISDLPNEIKINQLISRTTALTLYCDERFKHLMTNFKHDKTVLRFYASYLENFKFDKETAADLFEQAFQLEEEESKAQPIVKKFEKKTKPKTEKHFSIANSMITPPNTLLENRRNTMIELEEEKFEGIEVAGSTEKKHLFIRNALNTPYQSKVRNYTLIGLALFQIVLLLIAFILCIVLGSLVTEIPLSLDSCLPGTSPSSLMREVRMGQIYNELYNNLNISQPAVNSSEYETIQYFLNNHQRRLKRILQYLQNLAANSISPQFTTQMVEDYKAVINPIVVPTASVSTSDRVYTTSYKKNISMSELTREFISNTKIIYNWKNYNETIKSYEFMYTYLNRRAASEANGLFCSKFQIRKRAQNLLLDRILRIYLFTSTFVLIIIYGTFLIISRIGMSKSSRIINLFSKIPKEFVGSVYHDLQKRSTQEVKHLRRVVSPKFMSLSIGFLSLIVFSLCISFMYVENNLNVAMSSQAMVNVDTATSVIRACTRLNVRLGELFAFYGIKSGHSVNDPALANQSNLDTYHSDNRIYISEAQSQFAELLFGGNLTSSIFNKYPGVDEVITAPLTCLNGTCYDLQELVATVLHLCSKFNEDILNPFYAKAPDTFLYYLSIFNMTDEMIERLLELLTTLSSTSSSKVISIVFFVFGFFFLIAFNYYIYMSFHTTDYDITTLRTFLNYIPIDYLDSNDILKNFIVNNTLSNSSHVKRKTEYDDAIKNLLNSMVEGAVTCNERGEVTFINIAAQKMFGKSAVDVLGLSFTTLFDPSFHELMKKATGEFKYHTKGEENELGEVLEIDCIRKNSSKFPAKVSIFGTEINNSSFVSLFIKDITMEKKQNSLLAEEKKNSENLLRNILPEEVATKLKNGETFIAERFSDITCYFSDIIVNGFDDLTDKYNLEKIKTIGDSYFCVGGLHGVNAQSDHPERTLRFAIDTLSVIRSYNSENLDSQLNVRIGLNTGGVIAGVIGRKKFAYDLWGDTINTSSRMESTGVPGRIQLSRSTYERTYDLFEFEERKVSVKGKGECKTYLVKEKHHVNPIVMRPNRSSISIGNDLDKISIMISPAGEDI